MSVHPLELRWRVVSTYEGGKGSYEELAERFMVARSTVQEWMSLYRSTGDLEARSGGLKADPAAGPAERPDLERVGGAANATASTPAPRRWIAG